ncbi:hypothetical protein KTH22_01095 [Acinetobacter variabilis]|uniref:hypothetical protein n=1 Tax=Acinetobacter variabilis TaxID=70346 RepID=UPI0021CF89BE|nr:hypothetical protein [Acinetobacter variabilis]MCU4373742.1 hypothetical protein [Acinetobacter variabilis]
MSEKVNTNMTFRCTFDEKSKAEAIARVKKFNSISEYLRDLLIKDISATEEYLHCLAKEFDLAMNTVSTVHTPFFELAPEPLPKQPGTKKAQLLEQMDFLAVHSESKRGM